LRVPRYEEARCYWHSAEDYLAEMDEEARYSQEVLKTAIEEYSAEEK
jgi:hypothetical protein